MHVTSWRIERAFVIVTAAQAAITIVLPFIIQTAWALLPAALAPILLGIRSVVRARRLYVNERE